MQSNRLVRIAAWAGLIFAVTLAIVETVHNWGDWSDPPMWIVDYLACGLLLLGAELVLRRGHAAGPGVLAAGWGFACAMFWMAYFFIRAEFLQNASLSSDDELVLAVAGGLFLWTIVGLSIAVVGLFHTSLAAGSTSVLVASPVPGIATNEGASTGK